MAFWNSRSLFSVSFNQRVIELLNSNSYNKLMEMGVDPSYAEQVLSNRPAQENQMGNESMVSAPKENVRNIEGPSPTASQQALKSEISQ